MPYIFTLSKIVDMSSLLYSNVMNDKTYPIIGMSPGNSYFKDDEISYLLKTAIDRYGRVAVMIADVPAIATYLALGYSENRAPRDKAIPQGNLLKNRTERAMARLGYTKEQVRIIDWEHEVEPNDEYQECYGLIRTLYESNRSFQDDADETTKGVIVNSKKHIDDISAATKIAVHYLLSEFAFLDFAPSLLGVKKVTYFYHKNWTVYEQYIAGKYDGRIKKHVDFFLLENPWETYRSVWGSEDEERGEYSSALDRVQQTKTLRVAFTNYPPALIHNESSDAFSGIFYDIIMVIAQKHEWQVRWSEEVGYGVIIDGLDNERFDLFGSTVWPTPERLQKAAFSSSLYESKAYPWIAPGFEYDSMKGGADIRIAVKENDISHSIALADFPQARMVFVPQLSDPQELLEFVASGKADVTFAEPSLASAFIERAGATVVQATAEPIRVYENTFVFKKGDDSLKALFNDEIAEMLQGGVVSKLIEKYTGSQDTFK